MKRIALALLAAAPLAAAQASPPRMMPPADPYYSADILEGRLAQARVRLERDLATRPEAPEARLNLAYVYVRSGQQAAAAAQYRAVLAEPDVQLVTPNGNVAGAHAMAQAGLRRATQVAAR